MSLRVQCQKCKKNHSLNKRLSGRAIRCPFCDATIDVPAVSPTNASEIAEQEESVDGEITLRDVVFAEAELVDSEPISMGGPSIAKVPTTPTSDTSKTLSESNWTAEEEEEDSDELVFAKRELPKDDMDMTPMVDVTFLLLIFFMITASFTSEKVIEEPPPLSDKTSRNAKEEPDKILDTVRVQVDEFNAYTIILPGGDDRQASSKQDLIIALGDARKELVTGANDDALKLAVEAHTESIHAAVVAAIDAGREKGFSSIQVTVVEEFD
ncbi:MAG TPA: biopolymer transporter ExbD [Pirellula sp.]|nr:biopolymer transporter ExbD [Pirellula sp.]